MKINKKVRLITLKFELILEKINLKFPRYVKLTKTGIVTTFIITILATGFVVAQDRSISDTKKVLTEEDVQDSNLYQFKEAELISFLSNLNYALSGHNLNTHGGESEGAIQRVNDMIGTTYVATNDISIVNETYALFEDLKVVRPVQAQTPGFTTLTPVKELWKITRNISLSLIVVTGLILAVMILFRVQSGQGYVTIMNALSKLIVAVVLITFSFALGGVMLDITNIGTKFVVVTLVNDKLFHSSVSTDPLVNFPYGIDTDHDGVDEIQPGSYNVFRLMGYIVNFESWFGARDCQTGETPYEGFDGTPWAGKCEIKINDIIAQPTFVPFLDTGLDIAGGAIGDLTLDLIVKVLTLIVVIKVFLALIMSFLKIILRVITAPIEFMLIPMSGFGVIERWVRAVISSALVFPLTLAIILIAAVLSHQFDPPYMVDPTLDTIDNAPVLLYHSIQHFQVTSGSTVTSFSFLGGIMGIGLISFIPSLSNVIENLLKVEATPGMAAASEELRKAASKIPVVGGLVTSI